MRDTISKVISVVFEALKALCWPTCKDNNKKKLNKKTISISHIPGNFQYMVRLHTNERDFKKWRQLPENMREKKQQYVTFQISELKYLIHENLRIQFQSSKLNV